MLLEDTRTSPSPKFAPDVHRRRWSHSLPLKVTPTLNVNQQGSLTDEETTEVEV